MSNVITEHFSAGKITIDVNGYEMGGQLVLDFQFNHPCILHWGLVDKFRADWQTPPQNCWPTETRLFDKHAVQSVCQTTEGRSCAIRIKLDNPLDWRRLSFVLYLPNENKWLKNGDNDFRLELSRIGNAQSPDQWLKQKAGKGDWQFQQRDLDNGDSFTTALREDDFGAHLLIASNAIGPLMLHWGLAGKFSHQWQLPPAEFRPSGTIDFDKTAVRTLFEESDGIQWLELKLVTSDAKQGPKGINFILFQAETNQWLKVNKKDIYLALAKNQGGGENPVFDSGAESEAAERIIHEEMGKNSWTLMHRFNLCYDLLQAAEGDPGTLTVLFVWLRFSFLRQLDWQRNYNTQPRELGHAQDRLTLCLAQNHIHYPQSRPWIRLMLATLGRGGDGQKVRDEILHIMHRNHIKEVHGHFMEEWHQKLHNNTTLDDVVICEAYLAFLNSNGNLDQFYETLLRGGVTRERLQNFERPIHHDPEFYPDKRDGLSHDFEYFLRILKSVHSGTDLDTAASAARGVMDESLNAQLNAVYEQRHRGASLHEQVTAIISLRASLHQILRSESSHQCDARVIRELLYLDLALEQILRGAIEQNYAGDESIIGQTKLIRLVLQNIVLDGVTLLDSITLLDGVTVDENSTENDAFANCAKHLDKLIASADESSDWALHTKSVIDRAGRSLTDWSQSLFAKLQPKAEAMGDAFEVDEWTIPLFSEEIIRGGAGFMLSLLIRRIDPFLRTRAELGGWQVISPANTSGQVQVVDSLQSVQGDTFTSDTILITDNVAGDEEIPLGVTAIITLDSPDLVSHVAVRARNAHILFATCYDEKNYKQLVTEQGKQLLLSVTPSGDVRHMPAKKSSKTISTNKLTLTLQRREFSNWAVIHTDFSGNNVGGKSNNLQALRGKLSAWIDFPRSIALPFGVFEKTLTISENRAIATRLIGLQKQAIKTPKVHLSQIRHLLRSLHAPKALRETLLSIWRDAGLPPTKWALIWRTTKDVWASKWNERAWYSRIANGVNHDDLMMAVLIQQVVEADYAFVIHTVNPLNGSKKELLAEVVPGLGETLVGNYPGRALGFICDKNNLKTKLMSYPSKNVALYGKGIIFRSDSNGEDLERYAGAGLYDSFLAEPPETRLLDYTNDQLVWNRAFRENILRNITKLGVEIEQACGSAQDIEGVVQQGKFTVVQTRSQVGLSSD